METKQSISIRDFLATSGLIGGGAIINPIAGLLN